MTDRGRGKRPIKSTLMVLGIVTVSALLWTGCISGVLFVTETVEQIGARCEDMTGVAQIQCVNQRVNARIRYRSDADQYGVEDRWVSNPSSGQGDCEDYALTKADELERMGVSPNRMKIGVRNQTGGAHAFLVVDGLRADNRSPWLEGVPADTSLVPLRAARSFIGHGTDKATLDLMDDGSAR